MIKIDGSFICKTNPNFAKVDKARADMKMLISNNYKDLITKLNILINQDAVNGALQEKIDALKAAFNAIISKSKLTAFDLEEAEKILFKLRRIYVTQKAALDKRLEEENKAARASCAAVDFAPFRLD